MGERWVWSRLNRRGGGGGGEIAINSEGKRMAGYDEDKTFKDVGSEPL